MNKNLKLSQNLSKLLSQNDDPQINTNETFVTEETTGTSIQNQTATKINETLRLCDEIEQITLYKKSKNSNDAVLNQIIEDVAIIKSNIGYINRLITKFI